MKSLLLPVLLFFFNVHLSYAQPGELDLSFGDSGIVSAPGGGIISSAIQRDGKILLAGNNGSVLRYNTTGTPDNTFGTNGVLSTGFDVKSIEVTSNNKFVVAGNSSEGPGTLTADIIVARFNANGSPDNTFNGNGRQVTDFGSHSYDLTNSILIQKDGKIVLCGQVVDNGNTPFLMRYNINGSLDSTFDAEGKLIVNVQALLNIRGRSIRLQENDKIVFITSIFPQFRTLDIAAFRFNSNGTIDSTFDGDGSKMIDLGYREINTGLAIRDDGKIMLAGQLEGKEDGYVIRLNEDGSFDPSFSNDGKLFTDLGLKGEKHFNSIIFSDSGKVLIGGEYKFNRTQYLVMARFSAAGIPDSSFNEDGVNLIKGSGTISELRTFRNKLYAVRNPNGILRFQFPAGINKAPTVTLSQPPNNSTYLAGGNVYLTADAADEDGTISKVAFYRDGTLLYTVTDTPYAFKWEHVHKGNFTLTARATDNSGLVTTSAPVQISIVPNKPPSVSIINPANNQTFLKGGTIHLQAAAKDPDGRITRVEFYNGTKLLTTERLLPYTFDWAKVQVGNYTITAKAFDNWGTVTTSAAVNVSVIINKPPSVNIISPANGESFAAYSTINLQAAAKDPDGRIITVNFYDGTTLLATERKMPYTYQWLNVRPGAHTITAVAQDNWGEITTSAPVQIQVSAAVQCPVSSQPAFGFVFNGIFTANINNGAPDSSESASIHVCAGEEYTTSDHFHSSLSNLYNITDVATGGTLLFDGSTDYNRVITAAELSATAGTYTITLADPAIGGTLVQTITPFTDLNNNQVLDSGDCIGDPIVFTYTASPCDTPVCPIASRPVFGFDFNGTLVENINNGVADPGEAASVTLCDNGQYTTSAHFHSSISNLYDVVNIPAGGALLFDGFTVYSAVLTASDLTGTAGTHTISLADPTVGGMLTQTITPFTDLNENGILDDGDCTGDPIVFIYTATPCSTQICPVASQPTFGFNFNGTLVANINNGITDPGELAGVSLCNGGRYAESGRFHSSYFNLYDVKYVQSGGTIFFDGVVTANTVLTAAQYDYFQDTVTAILADPNSGGTVEQTITPFSDANNNGMLDDGDCAGDPIVISFAVAPCTDTQCPVSLQPTFGIDFNGLAFRNTNNGSTDSSELYTLNVCNGEQFTASSHINSDFSTLYDLTVQSTGGALLFNGKPSQSKVMSAAQFSGMSAIYTITLADPNIGGSIVQTTTAFTDINNNGILDDGDCAGDPIVATFIVAPCTGTQCPVSLQPTFGIDFNGSVFNTISNGTPDSSELFTLTVCNGEQFTASGHVHSSSLTLYDIVVQPSGGALLFNGESAQSLVMSAAQLSGTAATYNVTLADPNVGGSILQTIKPFTDLNNNGSLDDGDCAGDPIISTITAMPCSLSGTSVVSSKPSFKVSPDHSPFSLKVAPNPVSNILTIYTRGLRQNTSATVSIISVSGVFVKTLKIAAGTPAIPVDVSSLVNGVYIIKMQDGNNVQYRQFVKL